MALNRPTAVIGSAIMVGTRITTRFAEKRIGDVLDVWFEPDAM